MKIRVTKRQVLLLFKNMHLLKVKSVKMKGSVFNRLF